MSYPDSTIDLNTLAAALEQKTLDLIQAGRWPELDAMIAPECQFVTNGGVFDKPEAMRLMQGMQLTATQMRHVNATSTGDTLIVSFELACTELIGGKPQSKDFSPRLSVWKKHGDTYRCVAYGDFNRG
jgi:hypothetical protein